MVEYGKAQLTEVERDFYHLYCFLEKKWISKPSDYDLIDPEIKAGLITMMELESKKIAKEESKMKAEEALSRLKARSGL